MSARGGPALALYTTHDIPWLGPDVACEAWGKTVDDLSTGVIS